jgi:hypothetical protein
VVVATALCADHVAAAAPIVCAPVAARDSVPPVVQLAGRLVDRLSRSFRRTVPRGAPDEARRPDAAVTSGPSRPADQSLSVAPPPTSPFQFRLPPPAA